jgi:lipase maturation factor 1
MSAESKCYSLACWLFLRLLGICYFFAFLSLSQQILGLIGSNGILPLQITLDRFTLGSKPAIFLAHPTLFWLNRNDYFISLVTVGGVVAGFFITLGVLSGPALFLAWLLYLSLSTVCSPFLQFQWDRLLLESGFLAIFLMPWRWLEPPLVPRDYPYSSWVLWILRWLLFRLMFCSALVKIWSDPCWRNFTALYYHYETQPLPSPLAWYAHQLPHWFQRFSVGSMFFIELIAPFFIFGPPRLKLTAGILFCLLQVLIFLTGNYGYFNLLTIALCALLFNDAIIKRAIPHALKARFVSQSPILSNKHTARNIFAGACTMLIVLLSITQFWQKWNGPHGIPKALRIVNSSLRPYHFTNSYGLFWVMHRTRPELVLEGSSDGNSWLPYEFKYKPGDLSSMPPNIGLFLPRLDWEVTFAAYEKKYDKPWFKRFITKLFEGSPAVIVLLANNPFFSGPPPQYIRANLYQYQFTSFQERNITGNWWNRKLIRTWFYSRTDVMPIRRERY